MAATHPLEALSAPVTLWSSAAEELSSAQAAALDEAGRVDSEGVERLATLTARLADRADSAWGASADWLDDGTQEVEEMRELADGLADQAARLEVALERVGSLRPHSRETGRRVADACTRLPAQLARVEQALAGYYRLEVAFTRAAMCDRRAQCEIRARGLRDLDDQIASIEAQLGTHRRGWRRLLRRRPGREQRRQLVAHRRRLQARRDGQAEFLPEAELRVWLDAVITAGLYMAPEDWDEAARDARLLLYQLVNLACLQTRMPAHRVAARVLLHPDAHAMFEYCPESELYLSRYFGRARLDLFARHQPVTALRLQRFQHVRETMTNEYYGLARRG